MKKKKFFSLFLTVTIFFVSLSGCVNNKTEPTKPKIEAQTTKKSVSSYSDTKINIALIKTLPGVYAFLKLIQDSDNHLNNIKFFFAENVDEAFKWLDSGKVDAANLSYTDAFRYYNVGLKSTKMFFVTSQAPIYLLTKNNNIQSLQDIQNKILYLIGKPSIEELNCESIIRDFSKKRIRYANSLSDLYSKIEHGDVENCVVSSSIAPLILKKYPEFNIFSTLSKSAGDAHKGYISVYDCLVISQSYVNENRDKMLDLVSLFKSSGVFTNFHSNEAASIAVKYKIASSADIAKEIILDSNVGYYEKKNLFNYSSYYYINDYTEYYFGGGYPHSDYFEIPFGTYVN